MCSLLTWGSIGLRKERETFLPFSPSTHYSHRAQADAVERAATFRDRSKIILVRVKAKHDAWEIGVASQQRGGSRRSSRSHTQQPRGSPNTYGSASSQQTYAQVAVYEEQPLQTVQARASPVTVAPSPPSNALNLELGPRQSPRFPVMTPPQRRLHDSPMYQGSPSSPASSLGMGPYLTSFPGELLFPYTRQTYLICISKAVPPPRSPPSSVSSPSAYSQWDSSPAASSAMMSSSIRSNTQLPSVSGTPQSRASLKVAFADYRPGESPGDSTRRRRRDTRGHPSEHGSQAYQVRERRRAQPSLRPATVPATHMHSSLPATYTPPY
ncbi:hypothetical protein NUW54_g4288 [Trametes sanguinea]|uniref:Uncharacterized protein n=1 Tax=Trametes sanguinea TaxID=158606 RepID=A0ACC1Q088_9APHY|nr:hypothetical protein NUW54_g4288 [Trametes sanguinea]